MHTPSATIPLSDVPIITVEWQKHIILVFSHGYTKSFSVKLIN